MTLFRDVANWHKSCSNEKRAMKQWIDKLRQERTLRPEEFRQLLTGCDADSLRIINEQAREVSLRHFGNRIYIRGLIEISNCCRNNCYYCGIGKYSGLLQTRIRTGIPDFCPARGRRSCTDGRPHRDNRCRHTAALSGLCHYAITRRKVTRSV